MEIFEKIVFRKNWNRKLYCDTFTNIDLKSDRFKEGQRVKIYVKNRCFGIAIVEKIQYFKFPPIPEITCRLNSGLGTVDFTKELWRKYEKYDIDIYKYELEIVLFRYVERELISEPWRLSTY